jgi:hypothetical protein
MKNYIAPETEVILMTEEQNLLSESTFTIDGEQSNENAISRELLQFEMFDDE